MAEFKKEVFEMLALHTGFFDENGEPDNSKIPPMTSEGMGVLYTKCDPEYWNIENYKNALFRFVMLKARNEIERMEKAGEPSQAFCTVPFTLSFKTTDLHPDRSKIELVDAKKFLRFIDIIPTSNLEPTDFYNNDTIVISLAMSEGLFPLACA